MKTTLIFHFTSVRMTVIKRTIVTAGEAEEKGSLHLLLLGVQTDAVTMETHVEISQKANYRKAI